MTQTVLETKSTEFDVNNGLDDKPRQFFATALTNAVVDTYRLLVNTQSLHWNVQGPLFYSVHNLTEEQYEDLFSAVDDLAERARILGFPVKNVLKKIAPESSSDLMDEEATISTQIDTLARENDRLAFQFRDIAKRADQIGDIRTADMLTERVGVHEKNSWMLKATIASTS